MALLPILTSGAQAPAPAPHPEWGPSAPDAGGMGANLGPTHMGAEEGAVPLLAEQPHPGRCKWVPSDPSPPWVCMMLSRGGGGGWEVSAQGREGTLRGTQRILGVGNGWGLGVRPSNMQTGHSLGVPPLQLCGQLQAQQRSVRPFTAALPRQSLPVASILKTSSPTRPG